MGVWGTLCWLTAEWCGTTGGDSTATQAGGEFERNHFPAVTAYLPCRVPTDGPAPRGSCRQVAWLGLGCCVRFGTCCSPARERNPRFSPAVVPEGNRRDISSSALATAAGWPCVLGGHSWGCVSVPLCGAAASGLEGARVGPGWQRGRVGLVGLAEQLGGPTLIDLIGAAPRGWRNAGRPRFSRRAEAPGRPNH